MNRLKVDWRKNERRLKNNQPLHGYITRQHVSELFFFRKPT